MRIYLAGPYRSNDFIMQEANIREGRRATACLIDENHEVECPWLDRELLQVEEGQSLGVKQLQRNSMSKLKHWAEAVCLMPGWEYSTGTYQELLTAANMGLDLFLYRDFGLCEFSYTQAAAHYRNIGKNDQADALNTKESEESEYCHGCGMRLEAYTKSQVDPLFCRYCVPVLSFANWCRKRIQILEEKVADLEQKHVTHNTIRGAKIGSKLPLI